MEWRWRPPDVSKCQPMSVSEGKFGRKKEEAIVALLSQRSVDDAARVANVTPRTLYRWMKEPEFDAAYREARRAAFGQSIARLEQASGAAVSSVLKIMTDPTAPASTRLRAADIVLARSAKAIELEDVEARVSELERAARKFQSKPDEDYGKGELSNQTARLRNRKSQSTEIDGCTPAPNLGSGHGIALARLPKATLDTQE